MRLLAFESATRWLSVALWQDGVILERRADLPNGGSTLLLPWTNALLAEAGISRTQLDGIAFGAGPGGFTGLRLACGVAQGLAWGLDRPVVPVGTLAALALNTGRTGRVWAALDARMNEVYSAVYQVQDDAVTEVQAPVCVPPGRIAVPPASTCGGDAFVAYAGVIPMSDCVPNVWPTAAAVARLAAPALARGEGLSASAALPLYVRDKVALTTAERLARGGVR